MGRWCQDLSHEAEAVVRWLGHCYEALEQDLEQPDDPAPSFIQDSDWIEVALSGHLSGGVSEELLSPN